MQKATFEIQNFQRIGVNNSRSSSAVTKVSTQRDDKYLYRHKSPKYIVIDPHDGAHPHP